MKSFNVNENHIGSSRDHMLHTNTELNNLLLLNKDLEIQILPGPKFDCMIIAAGGKNMSDRMPDQGPNY